MVIINLQTFLFPFFLYMKINRYFGKHWTNILGNNLQTGFHFKVYWLFMLGFSSNRNEKTAVVSGNIALIQLDKFIWFNSLSQYYSSFIHWIEMTRCQFYIFSSEVWTWKWSLKTAKRFTLCSNTGYSATVEITFMYLVFLAVILLLNFLSRSDGYKYPLKQICVPS